MSSAPPALHAFEGCGIEIEYAIVHADSLDPAPIADAALCAIGGSQTPVCDVARGMFGWSNELALHVVELKNADPTVPLDLLAARFQFEARELNAVLAAMGARLMPARMHPWMTPATQARLWPHDGVPIYQAYDRIFDCRSHGYANLQSVHVNLSFADDAEFARLHDAIRLVLPILPAVAASSPYVEGHPAPHRDHRMAVYRSNAARVPAVTGDVVPDRCASRAQYEAEVLQPLYEAMAPHDADGILRHEWMNARGAIARFQRSALEIRVLDTQECPDMDVGIAALVVDLVQALTEGRLPAASGLGLPTRRLSALLDTCILDAEDAWIDDAAYLHAFGSHRSSCRAAELWECIGVNLVQAGAPRRHLWQAPLNRILTRGTLASRLLALAGSSPDRMKLRAVGELLCDALASGRAID